MSLACGIDVGGTKIAGGVVDESGTILEELRVESPATDVLAIEAAIEKLVTELRTRHPIEAVGVGAAGYIDKARAVVLFAPNLAWRDLDLKADLERTLELPVVVENDANAAAWGEFQFGAGHDVDDLLLVTVGTGVGGGLVLDGSLYRGAFGVGAEIGHMRVVPDGLLCGCGNRGCFEMYASGSALVREARAAARAGSLLAADLLERAGGDADAITGPLVTQAARDGDTFAIEQLSSIGRWLGEGIASLTAVLDPAVVVVGGGVSAADELLLAPTRTAFTSQLTGRGHRPALEIRRSRLGNRAGLIGAADLTRH
ncbi:MAG TPA: ROK family glucokinase [Nocardioides sp.]|uniref:ROK family glucokinase n=1 Tax=Nocardioides sp. TaxID=35761 RepID=UPI002F428590